MKRGIYLLFLMVLSVFAQSQKLAYVDTDYILKQIPKYKQAEERLQGVVDKWKEDIRNKQSTLDSLKLSFENEKILLTEEQQKLRKENIEKENTELKEYIDQKFGTKGELITFRKNFAKPIQDQIWNAIGTIATKEKYGLIFDKSSDLLLVYSDPKYDITNKVLKLLGAKDGKEDKENKTKPVDNKKKSTKNSKNKK